MHITQQAVVKIQLLLNCHRNMFVIEARTRHLAAEDTPTMQTT